MFHVVKGSDIIYYGNGSRFRDKLPKVNIFETEDETNENKEQVQLFVEDVGVNKQPVLGVNSIAELKEEFSHIMISMTTDSHSQPDLKVDQLSEDYRVEIECGVECYIVYKKKTFPIEMKIVLTDEVPIASRPRRTPYRHSCTIMAT